MLLQGVTSANLCTICTSPKSTLFVTDSMGLFISIQCYTPSSEKKRHLVNWCDCRSRS